MFGKSVLLLFIILGQRKCSTMDRTFNKLYDTDRQCDVVCVGSGGKAESDLKYKICKCTLDKNIDDVDRELIVKNANILGIKILEPQRKITKRNTNKLNPQFTDAYVIDQRTPKEDLSSISKVFKRQSSFQLPSTAKQLDSGLTKNKFTIPTLGRLNVTSNNNIIQRLQEIQNRINERISEARNRVSPHLQQRGEFETEKPNLMERLKQRQKEIQEQLKKKIEETSLPADLNITTSDTRKTNDHETSINQDGSKDTKDTLKVFGEGKYYELITQDPTLYENDK